MSEAVYRQSPLVQCPVADQTRFRETGVILGERPFAGFVNVRGDAADNAFLAAVAPVLDHGLPLEPNTVAESRARTAFWLGPNEWLLMTPPDGETELIQALRGKLENLFAAVTDVTGGYTVITVAGPRARDVLAKGCPLDLHPSALAPGQCAQTLIAKTGALLRPLAGEPARFDIIVRRSFADYLWCWLEDAAAEYR
jgi:sarcosine oxidase subunit gamma